MNDNSLLHLKLDLIARALRVYKIEAVEEVVRREYTREDGQKALVIDYYPPWSASGKFGKHKVVHEYMDYAWQFDRFTRWTGLNFADLPVYHSDRAAKRVHGQKYKYAVPVKRPFRIMIMTPQGEGDEKKKQFIRTFLPMQDNAPVEIDQNDPGQDMEAETEEEREIREAWKKIPWAYQHAYRTQEIDEFAEHVASGISLGSIDKIKKAIHAVMPDGTVFPAGQTRVDGVGRIRVYWALVHLSLFLENLTQPEAIERAKREYAAFELDKLIEKHS